MKPSTYIGIGVISTLVVIGSLAFNNVENNKENGTITFHKHIEASDPSCLQMYYYIEQYADSFDIPENYAFGIANAETGYKGPFHWNYNHKQLSSAGAVGPMQIMPATATWINGKKVPVVKLRSDIEYNVRTSMKLLRQLYDRYGDWQTVFGCYNTGRPCVNKYAVKVYNYEPDWKLQ